MSYIQAGHHLVFKHSIVLHYFVSKFLAYYNKYICTESFILILNYSIRIDSLNYDKYSREDKGYKLFDVPYTY